MLVAPLASAAAGIAFGAGGRMSLGMHENTSLGAPFRKAMEGWSRAGIKNVEIVGQNLDEFLKTDTIAGARRLLADLGLTPVSCGAGVLGVWEPGLDRAPIRDTLKMRCEQFASLGVDRIVCPANTVKKFTKDDYKRAVDSAREAGEIGQQTRMTVLLEFTRFSSFLSTLPTALQITREAAHPNVRPMLDCYHFWSGFSKFEDLDAIRPGEIAHVHFQDTADLPRELLDNTTRAVPGEGLTPLARILRKLAEKGYAGPLSVELMAPEFQQADPYELARRIRAKAEPIMRQARVA
jgi:sugar phosphate isomerase/epimerase